MSQTVVVIAEDSLLPSDIAQILAVAGPDASDYRVIVPTDADQSVVAQFLDHLAVLELKEAWDSLTGRDEPTPDEARAEAADALRESVSRLETAGVTVTSAGIADDVITALRAELETATGEIQVVAVTEPRAIEDVFHRGWSDRAESELGVAVLHFYRGTSHIEA